MVDSNTRKIRVIRILETEMPTQSSMQRRPQSRRTPQQRRSQQKVDAILRAAIRVLAEEGYSGASTVKIARAAGVGVGTVYDYFRDKDEIFSTYVDTKIHEIFETIAESLKQLEYPTVESAVRSVIEASVRFTVDNRHSLSAMVGKIPGVYDGQMLQDVMERLYQVSAAFYRAQGLAADEREARHLTWFLSNVVTGFFIRLVTEPDLPVDKGTLIEDLTTLVLGYIERRGRQSLS